MRLRGKRSHAQVRTALAILILVDCAPTTRVLLPDDDLYLADPYDRVDGTQDGLIRVNAESFEAMWFDALYFQPDGGLTRGV